MTGPFFMGEEMVAFAQDGLALIGRALLGLYFMGPGLMKAFQFEETSAYMAAHGMLYIPYFLILTIILQVGGGLALVVGYRTRIIAFVLAGLVIVINVIMHNFWTYPEGIEGAHEAQNFVKNLGIMAGLLAVSGLGPGRFSLDRR
jgi:putative oxidoreductase